VLLLPTITPAALIAAPELKSPPGSVPRSVMALTTTAPTASAWSDGGREAVGEL
jgi:hypothetical protein